MQQITSIPKLPARPMDGHKGTFGKVCIVAGSVGMTGAAALAGRSALRAGAGLVRVATPASALPIVASIEPCYTTISLPQDNRGRISVKALGEILKAAGDNDVLAFGPGMGVSRDIRLVLEALIEREGLRLVVDGDGLNNLSRIPGWPDRNKAQMILTPHPGEMHRLWTGLFRDPAPVDRPQQAARLAEHSATVVALKGAGTVVTDGGRCYVNDTGNPGMATAGSGDVLTGLIAALMGQGLSNFNATVLGVYLHGLAGDVAAERTGPVSLMATDVVDALPQAFKKLKSNHSS